jgi:hypothetical protein
VSKSHELPASGRVYHPIVVATAVGALFGRAEEVDALQQLLTTAAAGTGAVAFVEGESGIGKTRLLVEAMAIA